MVVCGNKLPSPEEWIFSPTNRPLLPDCELNALELTSKSVDAIHDILLKGSELLLSGVDRSTSETQLNQKKRTVSAEDRNSKPDDETMVSLMKENP